MDTILVWTDGSFSHKYNVGGWGIVLKSSFAGWHIELNGQVACRDANYAEIYAILSAICLLEQPSVIKLHTDSKVARQAVRGFYSRDADLRYLGRAIDYKIKPHTVSIDIARKTVGYGYLKRCHDLSRMATRSQFVDLEPRTISDITKGHYQKAVA